MAGKGFAHESHAIESVEWYTPPEIFEALGELFDLDPCSPGDGKSFVPARYVYTREDDGLSQEWKPDEFVFMNPPYGSDTAAWVEKLSNHGNGIGLVFSRFDTRWGQEYASKADAVCFVSGRIKFYKGNLLDRPGTPGAGSMLLAYGPRAVAAIERSGLGTVLYSRGQKTAL